MMHFGHPLPATGHLEIEVFKRSAVVDDEICLVQALFTTDLAGDAGVGVLDRESSVGDQSMDRNFGRRVDHHNSCQFYGILAIDQQRDIEHNDLVILGQLLALTGHVFAHSRMDYLVYALQFIWIIEDDFSQGRSIQFTILTNHTRTEVVDDFVKHGRSRSLELFHGGIGID